jgi:hypothetical protein
VRTYNQNHGTAKLWVATVMPGYDDRKIRPVNGFVRTRDDGEYYRNSWRAAIDSRPHWVIINSFNEWPEGSYIEPSRSYGNLYLDLTREWSARFKSAEFSLETSQPRQPKATPLPPSPSTPPPPAPLPEEEWPSTRWMEEQRCAFVPAGEGDEQHWIVFCPYDTMPGAAPALIY